MSFCKLSKKSRNSVSEHYPQMPLLQKGSVWIEYLLP